MIAVLVVTLVAGLSQVQHAPREERQPAVAAPETPQIVAVRRLFKADAGVLLWIRSDEQGLRLEQMEALWQPLEIEQFSEPMGDGIWVELLTHRLELMAAYRGTVPAPGEACALELPAVRGTWFVLLVERRGDETRILGQLEVGRELAKLVDEQKIPLAG